MLAVAASPIAADGGERAEPPVNLVSHLAHAGRDAVPDGRRLRPELGQQALDPLLLARQRGHHLAQPGHFCLRGLLGELSGLFEPTQLLFSGVVLLGEVFNGRGPAEYLLRVAAGEKREGLVGRAAHVARRGEPGELEMRGGELAVQRAHPGCRRLGGGLRPGEHLQPAAVLPGQLGRAGLQLCEGRRRVSVQQPASRAISR